MVGSASKGGNPTMNKLMLPLAVVATLGLAACSEETEDAAATTAADAGAAVEGAVDATGAAVSEAGAEVEAGAAQAGAAVEGAATEAGAEVEAAAEDAQ
jgi:hypothetical protein